MKQLEIIKVRDNVTTMRATTMSEGVDITLPERVFIHPNSVASFKLGIKLNIPKGYYVELHPRSSMFHKLHLLAQVGIIDNDFKEELGYAFYNPSGELVVLPKGMRVCQMIIKKSETLEANVDVVKNEVRVGGMGSTGV